MKYQEVYRGLNKRASNEQIKKLASIIGMVKRASGGSYLKNLYLPGAQNSEPVTAKNPDYINMLKDKNKELSAAEARQAFWKDLAGSPIGRLATGITNPVAAVGAGLRRTTTAPKSNMDYSTLAKKLIQPMSYGTPAGLGAAAIRGDAQANESIRQGMINWADQQMRTPQSPYK